MWFQTALLEIPQNLKISTFSWTLFGAVPRILGDISKDVPTWHRGNAKFANLDTWCIFGNGSQ